MHGKGDNMKNILNRTALLFCCIAVLTAVCVAVFFMEDTKASGTFDAMTYESEMSTEAPMGCARFTDEEIDFLREIINREAGAQDEYEVDVPPVQNNIEANCTELAVSDDNSSGSKEFNDCVDEQPAEILYSAEDLNILALVIYTEAGGDIYLDETRMMVGNVFLNRVASNGFPNTFYEVATAYGQYSTLYWTGIVWPERSTYECEKAAVERAFNCAKRLLDGERIFETNDVVWQAEFPQGTETVKIQDGIFFCR